MLNSFDRIDKSLIDFRHRTREGHTGYPEIQRLQDTPDVLRQACGAAARDFPKELWIEPRHWEEKARQNDRDKTWPMNYLDRYTNQNPTHECTCHSLRANAEAARNRQRGIKFEDGPKKGFRYEQSKKGSVWLSPLSVYAEANPRRVGGAGIRQVLEIMVRRGMLPEKIQPAEYNFKHTLQGTTGTGGINQAKGPWVGVSQFPQGWEATAELFMPLEIIFAEMWEQAVCLVLHGIMYSVGRSGHAVPWGLWNHAQQVMLYPDSYDVTRGDSLGTVKSAFRGGFGIQTMKPPEAGWMNPANNPQPTIAV